MLSATDRQLIATAQSRAILAQLVSYLPLYRNTIAPLHPAMPSYVNEALANVQTAIDRWSADAKTL